MCSGRCFKDSCSENLVVFAEKHMSELSVKEVTACRVPIYWNEVLCQVYFLGISKIFNITNSSNVEI